MAMVVLVVPVELAGSRRPVRRTTVVLVGPAVVLVVCSGAVVPVVSVVLSVLVARSRVRVVPVAGPD